MQKHGIGIFKSGDLSCKPSSCKQDFETPFVGVFFLHKMKNKLSKKEFNLLAKDGRKVVPFFKRIMADTITPTAAWANLSMHSDYGFILESVEKAKKNGRYSYAEICSVQY